MDHAVAAVSPGALMLGRYRPLRPLGSGGSGSVWLARDEQSGLEVALKIVEREGKAGARAEREAAAAARLRHERCQRVYAIAHDAGHVYLASEYVPGRTWRQALRAGDLDDRATLEAAAQVLDGLAHAHAQGVVHRDVKPSNVLLAEGPEVDVRLLDFGLAQFAEAEALTGTGDVPGTLAYISPERLRGETAGPAADIWAVGVMLWEALAGWHPFWKASVVDAARRIEEGAPELATVRPELPRSVLACVDRALAGDPAARPSARALANALRRDHWARGRKQAQPRPRRPEKRRRAPRAQVNLVPARRMAGLTAPSVAAGLFAGWTAGTFAFFPSGWPAGLGALAALLTLARARAGLAFALAVPILPLGNLSFGLALLYAGLAAAWLALSWREPRTGLFLVVGPLLAPLSLLGLLPAAALVVRGGARRTAQAAAALLGAALVAGIGHHALPLTGAKPPASLGLAELDGPLAAAHRLFHALAVNRGVALEAVVLAAAAAALPYVRRRNLWWIAGFGCALIAGTLLAAPEASAAPLVLTAWATCLGLAGEGRRLDRAVLRSIRRPRFPRRLPALAGR